MVPVRVCDRCYHDIGGVGSAERESSISSVHVQSYEVAAGHSADKSKLSDRKRERRSVVVDELASRIHSTVIVHN